MMAAVRPWLRKVTVALTSVVSPSSRAVAADPGVDADEVTSAVTKARSIFWAMSALAFAASADSFAASDISLLSRELFFNNCSCHQNMMAWMAATATNDPANSIIHP
jgi:hypothetical protein